VQGESQQFSENEWIKFPGRESNQQPSSKCFPPIIEEKNGLDKI
jgi:hypothetical protein